MRDDKPLVFYMIFYATKEILFSPTAGRGDYVVVLPGSCPRFLASLLNAFVGHQREPLPLPAAFCNLLCMCGFIDVCRTL